MALTQNQLIQAWIRLERLEAILSEVPTGQDEEWNLYGAVQAAINDAKQHVQELEEGK